MPSRGSLSGIRKGNLRLFQPVFYQGCDFFFILGFFQPARLG